MARIDRMRESYGDVTERLFSGKTAFEDYLKFAGKFFKMPYAQSMTVYSVKPNAAAIMDFVWHRY